MIAALATLALWDLDAGDGGFAASGAVAQWEWGAPTTGPGGASRVWATRLGGRYLNDGVDTLEIPLPDVTSAAAPVMVVDHWYDIVLGDAGTVEIETDAGWAAIEPIYGYPSAAGFTGASGGWTQSAFDLSDVAAGGRARLVFRSDLLLTAAGWYVRSVAVYDGDAAPPRISATLTPGDTQDLDGPYLIELAAEDDVGVEQIDVFAIRQDGVELRASAAPLGDGAWRAQLPGQPPGTTLSWWAVARDTENEARWPAEGEETFRVYLAAPTGLRGPAGRVIGTSVALAWDAPVSPEPVLGYRVVELGHEEEPIDVTTASAEAPLRAEGSAIWSVTARYSAGLGEWSEPLALDAEVTAVGALEPASAWPGDRLRVRIEGESLYLVGGVSAVGLGEGIVVESLDVVDTHSAIALVRLDEAAAPGPRALSIRGAFGAYTFPMAFTVDDATGRPRVVGVAPEAAPQGWQGALVVDVSEPFAGPCTVDLPADVVAAGDPVIEERRLSIEVVVSGRAAPGGRTLWIDDGERLWEVPFTIEERPITVGRGCSTSAGGGWAWIGLAALCLRRRGRISAAWPIRG